MPPIIANELRAYLTPNILELESGKVTVQADAQPKSAEYKVSNLVENFKNRSSGNDLYPLIAPASG